MPPWLNTLSTGADEAGIDRICFANAASAGNSGECFLQKRRGLLSCFNCPWRLCSMYVVYYFRAVFGLSSTEFLLEILLYFRSKRGSLACEGLCGAILSGDALESSSLDEQ